MWQVKIARLLFFQNVELLRWRVKRICLSNSTMLHFGLKNYQKYLEIEQRPTMTRKIAQLQFFSKS
jgi:hypothetical protein